MLPSGLQYTGHISAYYLNFLSKAQKCSFEESTSILQEGIPVLQNASSHTFKPLTLQPVPGAECDFKKGEKVSITTCKYKDKPTRGTVFLAISNNYIFVEYEGLDSTASIYNWDIFCSTDLAHLVSLPSNEDDNENIDITSNKPDARISLKNEELPEIHVSESEYVEVPEDAIDLKIRNKGIHLDIPEY